METRSVGLWLAMFLVIIVGINIAFFFGSLFKVDLSNNVGAVTGLATSTNCYNVYGGVKCLGVTYSLKPLREDCPASTVQTCTNFCELDKAMAGDDRVCPTYCNDYCLSPDVAALLEK